MYWFGQMCNGVPVFQQPRIRAQIARHGLVRSRSLKEYRPESGKW
jgi:hypothetical protein